MQLIVHFNKTHVLNFEEICDDISSFENGDSVITIYACDVKEKLFQLEKIPVERILLQQNGKILQDDYELNGEGDETIVLRATISSAICGGKGGFGAMLRAKAKQRGTKQTTDFGMCRDLSGRRLKHVNDEIILQKWQESKKNGEAFDPSAPTATGVENWHLALPSWAEGIKADPEKEFMKARRKTQICIDWQRAREGSEKPPKNATNHWGCPRGARCDFAHGESELRGAALEEMQDNRQKCKREEESHEKDKYLAPFDSTIVDEEEDHIKSAVLSGLKKEKRAEKKSKTDGVSEEKAEKASSSKSKAKVAKAEVEEDESLPLDFGF